jgi:hypothetical protein
LQRQSPARLKYCRGPRWLSTDVTCVGNEIPFAVGDSEGD